MAPTLFFSYSHVDEALRNQLEVQLSALKRQVLIPTWHDRRITASTPISDDGKPFVEPVLWHRSPVGDMDAEFDQKFPIMDEAIGFINFDRDAMRS